METVRRVRLRDIALAWRRRELLSIMHRFFNNLPNSQATSNQEYDPNEGKER